MCASNDVKCEVKVIELKDGFQVQITGGKVKDILKPENLRKCIQACCSGEGAFKNICAY